MRILIVEDDFTSRAVPAAVLQISCTPCIAMAIALA